MTILSNRLPWSSFEVHSFQNADNFVIENECVSEIEDCLSKISFTKQDVIAGGGGKTTIAKRIEDDFHEHGWVEKDFEFVFEHDGRQILASTHKVDAIKSRLALEVEWNTKDTSFDRDLNVFRILHTQHVIDCGIIITRSSKLQKLFKQMTESDGLSKNKFMSTTTHLDKLLTRLICGGAGSCPVLAIAITENALKDRLDDELSDIFVWETICK